MTITPTPYTSFFRKHPVFFSTAAAFVVLILVFDWNWFRHPLESYITKKTQRSFTISDLKVRLGLTPTIRMRDLTFANAAWGKPQPMASARILEFSVSIRDLFDGKVLVPRVALTDAVFLFERLKDDRKNWILSDPSDTSPSTFRISTLSVDNGRLQYFDYGIPFELAVGASTFDPKMVQKVRDADAKPVNNQYSTRYVFRGKYHDAGFSGVALTGEVLSFQESGQLFPLQGNLVAGTTKLDVVGAVADAANISAIDVNLRISGETLANLYPFLLLPLPASPPYELRGHLVQKESRYTFDRLEGKIGSTDVYGTAAYVDREPRPLLTADLHSKRLVLSDMGPLIGVQTKEALAKPRTTQAETNSRQAATTAERVRDGERLLPAGSFEGSRLQKIDADVKLESRQLVAPTTLPFESLRVSLKLQNAVLTLSPLEFGFAGGAIVSQITLDARQPTIKSHVLTDFRRLRLDRLMPDNAAVAKAAGTLGARLDIAGSGNSIADAAATANGTLNAAVANGRISNLMDALSGLNGGKAVTVLLSGDKEIAVRCGGLAFNIANGQGTSTLFVVDTEQTQTTGSGFFDLKQESFDLKIEPKPKKPGIFSLRTPVRVYGTFRHPQFALEKTPLTLRAGAAIALAIVNPFAALIPLIETGPGKDTNCAEVLKAGGGAQRQATAGP